MSLDEKDIELMLQQHTRHCAEQRTLDDMRAHYGSYLRRANRRHYAIVACMALLLIPSLWVATPRVQAQATSHGTIADNRQAVATAEQIIQNL